MATHNNWKKVRNYFMTMKFSIGQANSIIKQYGKSLNMICPERNDYSTDIAHHNAVKLYLYEVSDKIQTNWDDFMKFWLTIKKNYTVKKLKTKRIKQQISPSFYDEHENGKHWMD